MSSLAKDRLRMCRAIYLSVKPTVKIKPNEIKPNEAKLLLNVVVKIPIPSTLMS